MLILTVSSCHSSKNAVQTEAPVDKRPYWVKNRPIDNSRYIGIGIAIKTKNPAEYQLIAKKNALNDLSSEIKVTISSNSLLMDFQREGNFRESFESSIKITMQENIEGYELIDSYDDGSEYWVYYALDKSLFESQKQQKMDVARNQATDLYLRSVELLKNNNYHGAFSQRVRALQMLQPFFNEPLEADINGKKVQLTNELLDALQLQLTQTCITVSPSVSTAKYGRSIEKPFEVTITFDRNNSPLSNIPIKLIIEKGNAITNSNLLTNEKGIAHLLISKVNSPEPNQFFKTTIDIDKLLENDSIHGLVKSILSKSLRSPVASFQLQVSGVKIWIASTEMSQDTLLKNNILEPVFTNALSQRGYRFAENSKDADFIILINANTIKGDAIANNQLFNSYLNASFTVKDTRNNIIYKDALVNIKGIQLTYGKASLDAYKKGSEQLKGKFVDSLVQSMQN